MLHRQRGTKGSFAVQGESARHALVLSVQLAWLPAGRPQPDQRLQDRALKPVVQALELEQVVVLEPVPELEAVPVLVLELVQEPEQEREQELVQESELVREQELVLAPVVALTL